MKVQLEQRRQVTGEKERERWKVGHILIRPPERYCRMQHTSIWNLHVIGINYESVSYLFIYKIFDYTSHVFYPFLLEWCCKCVCKIVWAVYISYSWIFVATASQTWVVSYCILRFNMDCSFIITECCARFLDGIHIFPILYCRASISWAAVLSATDSKPKVELSIVFHFFKYQAISARFSKVLIPDFERLANLSLAISAPQK